MPSLNTETKLKTTSCKANISLKYAKIFQSASNLGL